VLVLISGERAILDHRSAAATVAATETARIARIPVDRLWQAMERSPRSCSAGWRKGRSLAELLAAAGLALRDAKRDGRNRVCLAEPQSATI